MTSGDAFGWNALHHACANGWLEGAEQLLKNGVDATALTIDKCTCLEIAITAGNHALVERLLKEGPVLTQARNRRYGGLIASATARAAEGADWPMIAILQRAELLGSPDAECVRYLRGLVRQQLGRDPFILSPGEELQFERPEPETLGFDGRIEVSPEAAQLFRLRLSYDAAGEISAINSERFIFLRSDAPATALPPNLTPPPLLRASEHAQRFLHGDDVPIVPAFEELCRLGAEAAIDLLLPRVQFWKVTTPREGALTKALQHPRILAKLIAALPDDTLGTTEVLHDVYTAVERANTSVIEALVPRGLSLNAALDKWGPTSFLHAAIFSQQSATVAALLRLGADPNRILPAQSPWPASSKSTPLLAAVASSLPPLVEALLKGGADANLAADPHEISTHPLAALSQAYIYRSENRKPIFDMLIAAGASPLYHDLQGRTALHVERHTTHMEWLVAAGADLEAKDNAGLTPVQVKVCDSYPVAMGLLRYKRGLDARDAEGNTLVHLACFSNWPNAQIFSALANLGLDLNEPNNAGITPLQAALLKTRMIAFNALLVLHADDEPSIAAFARKAHDGGQIDDRTFAEASAALDAWRKQ